jgi:hypothetical protein
MRHLAENQSRSTDRHTFFATNDRLLSKQGVTMANPMQSQNAAQKNAERYFRRTEPQPDTPGKQMRKWERAASATHTARLRELRLAKETTGKEAPAVRSVLRMSY